MLKIDIWNIVFAIANILILYVLLRIFLWKPVLAIMDKREKLIKESLDEAEQKRADAENRKAEAERELSQAKATAEAKAAEILNSADAKKDSILESAKNEAEAIVSDGRARAELEKKQILDSARGELVELAAETAEKLAGVKADRTDADALFSEIVEKAGK